MESLPGVSPVLLQSPFPYLSDISCSSQRTSHPVGTTVRIADFLKHIPVRRQTAVKAATNCLTKIKKLIQAYAFAQPSRRFSLKVLKAKNESNNWIYAPGTDSSLPDAAMKIVGIDVASCCVMKQFSSLSTPRGGTGSDQNDYKLMAFLPAADTGTSPPSCRSRTFTK